MTLQEIITSLDDLSLAEQTSLLNILQLKLERSVDEEENATQKESGERFWRGLLNFRAAIEREQLIFTDEDFANLRDRSPGRDIELCRRT